MSTKSVVPLASFPEQMAEALRSREEVWSQGFTLGTQWWNKNLKDRSLPGWPLSGLASQQDRTGAKHSDVYIDRAYLFSLAGPTRDGTAEDADILRLLWHVLLWGSGRTRRGMIQRMDSFAGDAQAKNVQVLRDGAAFAVEGNVSEAYRTVLRKIRFLGPSYFTKFLYFAGAGDTSHRPLILDARVARSLHDLGWRTLPRGWAAWSVSTYERYIELAEGWAQRASHELERKVASEEIEMVLWRADGFAT